MPKEVLRSAGIAWNEFLHVTVSDGVSSLVKAFRHKTLEERAAEFDGKLMVSKDFFNIRVFSSFQVVGMGKILAHGGISMLNVLVVYCHPCENSFTNIIKNSFIKGLEDAGHTYVISDLYKEGFNPVMSESEYMREGFYRLDMSVLPDVTREQERINASDAIVFIYPDFWTASPAMLEGWFQRVWTYGFAYGDSPKMKVLDKALFLITMGGSLNDEIRKEQLEAMKTIMVGDRIRNRAKECEVYAFDQMTRGYGNDNNRNERIERFSVKAYEIAKSL